MKQVVVVGNCLSAPLARLLRLYLPTYEIKRLSLESFSERFQQAESFEGHIVLQPSQLKYLKDRRASERIHLYPAFTFTGFHPDCIYLTLTRGQREKSPIGEYHSAIAVGAFISGLTVRDAFHLFNRYIYTELGYFSEFNRAQAYLMGTLKTLGMAIGDRLLGWAAGGSFMHTINHPKLHVTGEIARQVGMAITKGALDPVSTDKLGGDEFAVAAGWPLYTEIAAALGLEGDYRFRASMASVRAAQPVHYELPEFLERSFDLYSHLDFSGFAHPVVNKLRSLL